MLKYIFILLTTPIVFFSSCSNGQSNTDLSPTEFSSKMNSLKDAPVIDVRTPEEFAGGHIANAKNFNWNGNDFDAEIKTLDKSTPVFVYCQSGGRSSDAADHMREAGFKEVYELAGGMMKWRANDLPVATGSRVATAGMSREQFDKILDSEKLILVDFYAEWCAPCKKMKPYLEEIDVELKDKVKVIRIDVDENQALSKELRIEVLPTLQLYKNKAMIWMNEGYIGKEQVLEKLK